VMAVANTKVPRFTLIVGGSFGAGNYGMCGRAYSPRLLFTWPSARTSVMGGEQAAGVLFTVKQEQLRRQGQALMDADAEREFKQPTLDKYAHEGSPYYSTSRLWDDGLLDPLETRRVLGLSIAMSMKQPIGPPRYGIFRM
jgi:3-methylcrotonyl-CoA carboxylase beta subunit